MYGGDSRDSLDSVTGLLVLRGYGHSGGYGSGYAGGSIEAEIALNRLEATKCCCQPRIDPKPKPEFDSGPAIPRGNFIERLKIKVYLFFLNKGAK